jgi:hypothetical protein
MPLKCMVNPMRHEFILLLSRIMQHHACHYDFRSPTSHKPADDPITLIDDATKNIIRLVRLQDNIRLSLVKGTVSMRNVVAYYCEQKQVLHTRYRVGQVMKPRSPENLYSHTHTHILKESCCKSP